MLRHLFCGMVLAMFPVGCTTTVGTTTILTDATTSTPQSSTVTDTNTTESNTTENNTDGYSTPTTEGTNQTATTYADDGHTTDEASSDQSITTFSARESSERPLSNNTTSGEGEEESDNLIIIVAVAAVSGVLVGVIATVVVVICRRNSGDKKTTRRLSVKRNLSYTVNKVEDDQGKPIPEYIQILPDVDGNSYSDEKRKSELTEYHENIAHKENVDDHKNAEDYYYAVVEKEQKENNAYDDNTNIYKNTAYDYDAVEEENKPKDKEEIYIADDINISKSTEDDYDVVVEEQGPNNKQFWQDDYSHIASKGRKISDSNYSHLSTKDEAVSEKVNSSETGMNHLNKAVNQSEENKTISGNAEEYGCSNLNARIQSALLSMDKTINSYEDDNSIIYMNEHDTCENDDDEDETYNHLGSFKLKNGSDRNKYLHRTRSRSLPAHDLQLQVKAISDEPDTYNHIFNQKLSREPTYYNWEPLRHAKSRSLPATENMQYAKSLDCETDTYSHINLGQKQNERKRKNAVVTHNPDNSYLDLSTAVSYDLAVDDYTNTALDNEYSTVNRIPQNSSSKTRDTPKQSIFTIQENDNTDEEPHHYFILEPSTQF